jgi:hypothetical protein
VALLQTPALAVKERLAASPPIRQGLGFELLADETPGFGEHAEPDVDDAVERACPAPQVPGDGEAGRPTFADRPHRVEAAWLPRRPQSSEPIDV